MVDVADRTMAEPKRKNWIRQAAPKARRGVFKAKAEAAGKSTAAFAREHAGDSGSLGKQARLAQTLMGFKPKRAKLYDHPRSKNDD
jgi:hypothetical protein